MPFWHRIVIAAAVFIFVWVIARVVDWWLKRRGPLAPEAQTRYLVLRRAVTVSILVVGFLLLRNRSRRPVAAPGSQSA